MSSNNLLLTNVQVFAGHIRQSILDMVGVEVSIQEDSLEEALFAPQYNMTVMIHFTGPIQGEYALSMDEKIVANMIGCYSEGMPEDELIAMREDYGGFIKEALNASVGSAIENLSQEFEDLTFLPPVIIYGKIDYPLVPGGKISMQSDIGGLESFFVLNMMGLELGERLQQTLKELKESAQEASKAKRNVEGMLEAFPSGMVILNKEGVVQPGSSKLTAKTVGLSGDAEVTGMYVPELLGFEDIRDVINGFKPWLIMAWDKINLLGIKTIVELCPLIPKENNRGVYLEMNWVPRYDENEQLDSLMLIIEDVTEKKRVEEEMRRLNEMSERNMELVTQVLNLEPDEVTEFLYDSTGLLSQAKNTIRSATRDRQFIEELYRTVHTLKGNSGQFQFKGLQQLASDIENDLSMIKAMDQVDGGADLESYDFSQIDANLEEANIYLSRLEEMQTKLGPKDETLEHKAERNKPAIMVPFTQIEEALDCLGDIHTIATKDKHSSLKELTKTCGQKIAAMREVPIQNFQNALNGAIQRTAEKLNKKIHFKVEGNEFIDIEIFRTLHRGFVHLINNAVDHGIETPEERESLNKLPIGMISLSWKKVENNVIVELYDDGRGIDFKKVLEKYNEEYGTNITDLNDHHLIEALFNSGFSTRDHVTDFSGRGVGLDAVKHLIEELEGTINVTSEENKGTSFVFKIPLKLIQPSLNWGN